MTSALMLYRSTIGKKAIVGVTGLIMFGFVIGHMLGNFKIYQVPEEMNAYGAFLHSQIELLWPIRIVLLVSVVAHIVFSIQLARQSLISRPAGYARQHYQRSSYAARTMRWGGPIIGLFIVYH